VGKKDPPGRGNLKGWDVCGGGRKPSMLAPRSRQRGRETKRKRTFDKDSEEAGKEEATSETAAVRQRMGGGPGGRIRKKLKNLFGVPT